MSEERSGRVHTFLRLEDVHFAFAGTNCTLQGINLALAAGEVHCILGRSGCGKTTLLKLAAGLLTPKIGTVSVGGRPPAAAREDIGFVFQQSNLLEWLTVCDNVLLPLALQAQPAPSDRQRALQLLASLGLEDLHGRYPRQLSGGQQSRVALARALVRQPALLLLDEPFASLDTLTREALQQDLLALCSRHATTALFVTHDIAEAVFLADRVSVMVDGCITHQVSIDLPRPRSPALRSSATLTALSTQVREALANQAVHEATA